MACIGGYLLCNQSDGNGLVLELLRSQHVRSDDSPDALRHRHPVFQRAQRAIGWLLTAAGALFIMAGVIANLQYLLLTGQPVRDYGDAHTSGGRPRPDRLFHVQAGTARDLLIFSKLKLQYLLRYSQRLEDSRAPVERGGGLLYLRRRPGELGQGPRPLRRDLANPRRQGLRAARQSRIGRPDGGHVRALRPPTYLHERHISVGRWHVAGLAYSGPTPFNTPGEHSVRRSWPRAWSDSRNWKPAGAHLPRAAFETQLDRVRSGLHAGSTAVRDFIEKYQPEYFFCGHIHEAQGVEISMRKDARPECGEIGLFVRIGLTSQ